MMRNISPGDTETVGFWISMLVYDLLASSSRSVYDSCVERKEYTHDTYLTLGIHVAKTPFEFIKTASWTLLHIHDAERTKFLQLQNLWTRPTARQAFRGHLFHVLPSKLSQGPWWSSRLIRLSATERGRADRDFEPIQNSIGDSQSDMYFQVFFDRSQTEVEVLEHHPKSTEICATKCQSHTHHGVLSMREHKSIMDVCVHARTSSNVLHSSIHTHQTIQSSSTRVVQHFFVHPLCIQRHWTCFSLFLFDVGVMEKQQALKINLTP